MSTLLQGHPLVQTSPAEALQRDPVCGMSLSEAAATVTAEYNQRLYAFCSTDCRNRFLANPARYSAAHGGEKGIV